MNRNENVSNPTGSEGAKKEVLLLSESMGKAKIVKGNRNQSFLRPKPKDYEEKKSAAWSSNKNSKPQQQDEEDQFDVLDVVRARAAGTVIGMAEKEIEKQKVRELISEQSNSIDQARGGLNNIHKETKKSSSPTEKVGINPTERNAPSITAESGEFNILDVVRERSLGSGMGMTEKEIEKQKAEELIGQQSHSHSHVGATAGIEMDEKRKETSNDKWEDMEFGEFNVMEVVHKRAVLASHEEPDFAETKMPEPPVPIARQRPVNVTSPRPGAYSGAPGEGLKRLDNVRFSLVGVESVRLGQAVLDDTSAEDAESERIIRDESILTNTCHSTGLAEATPVEDDISHDTEAQPLDLDASKKRKSMEERRQSAKLGLMAILVMAVVAAVVGLVFRESKEDSEMVTTSSPTQAPTLSLRTIFLDLLPDYTQEAIATYGTPQSKAFEWLMEDPSLLDYPKWRMFQRLALATYFYSTDGPNWYNNTHWLDYKVHECEWWSSNFFEEYIVMGIPKQTWKGLDDVIEVQHWNPCEEDEKSSSHEERRIKHLYLYNNGLKGSLPLELFWLTNLRILNGWQNSLTGTIPSLHISFLTDLEGLYLGGNDLTGKIPSEIALLSSSLSYLGLNSNSFSGALPTELENLTQMRMMGADSNLLTGTIPSEMGNLSNLILLYLSANHLTGTIATTFGLLTNLVDFSAYRNHLSGSIPTELGIWEALDYLGLSQNQLTGTIPPELGNLANLSILSLHDNKFSGSIPTKLGCLSKLFRLTLHDNKLGGNLPSELGLITAMRRLHLSNNSLTGSIPIELSNYSSVGTHLHLGFFPYPGITIDLHGNYLTGSLPTDLGLFAAADLVQLLLFDNQLTGPIPSELGLLTALSNLQLQDNELSGNLPLEMEWLAPTTNGNLTKLNITNNAFTGIVPESLCLIEELVFDCSPDAICGCRCNCVIA